MSAPVLPTLLNPDEPAAQALGIEPGGEPQHLVAVDVSGAGQLPCGRAGGTAQGVAGTQPHVGAALGGAAHLGGERDELADGADEVRGGAAQEHVALARALHGDADGPLGEVAQPAVDEFGAPAAGAPGQVAPLDERGAQAARGGVERGAGAGDAPADDEDVEGGAVAQLADVGEPPRGREG